MYTKTFHELKKRFRENMNTYKELIEKSLNETTQVCRTKDPMLNVFPFEHERQGVSLGKKLRTAKNERQTHYEYYFKNNELIRVRQFRTDDENYTDYFIEKEDDHQLIYYFDSLYEEEPLSFVCAMIIRHGFPKRMFTFHYNGNKTIEKYYYRTPGAISRIHVHGHEASTGYETHYDLLVDYKNQQPQKVLRKTIRQEEILWMTREEVAKKFFLNDFDH